MGKWRKRGGGGSDSHTVAEGFKVWGPRGPSGINPKLFSSSELTRARWIRRALRDTGVQIDLTPPDQRGPLPFSAGDGRSTHRNAKMPE